MDAREAVAEKGQEQREREARQERERATVAPVPIVTARPSVAPVAQKDPLVLRIEDILSERLDDVYKNLSPDVKVTFKAKGEDVAKTIQTWIAQAKLVARHVLKLIRSWLLLVPNVNRYFLEQESKIKTDKIMALQKEHDEVSPLT